MTIAMLAFFCLPLLPHAPLVSFFPPVFLLSSFTAVHHASALLAGGRVVDCWACVLLGGCGAGLEGGSLFFLTGQRSKK